MAVNSQSCAWGAVSAPRPSTERQQHHVETLGETQAAVAKFSITFKVSGRTGFDASSRFMRQAFFFFFLAANANA